MEMKDIYDITNSLVCPLHNFIGLWISCNDRSPQYPVDIYNHIFKFCQEFFASIYDYFIW